jgi:hypothetical protein
MATADETQVCGTKPAMRQFKRYQRECGELEGFERSE